MPTSNIDELLLGGKTTTHPETPEHHDEALGEVKDETPEYGEDEPEKEPENETQIGEHDEEPEEQDPEETKAPEKEYDDYGNEREPENKEIRERLKKQARKYESEIESLRSQLAQQGASREVQQAAKDFEYDPNSGGDWQQQLAQFVRQEVKTMARSEQEEQQRNQDAQIQREFEGKFRQGMGQFNDFVEVINELPFEISNPMTLATRAMENPAAFLYAAAKRESKELERISKIRDPYAQMTEIGKLEERMRRNKPSTKAPRPLGRTPEDASSKETTKKKELSGDDLLARADAKRINTVKTRLKANR